MRPLNTRFLVRATIVSLILAIILLVVFSLFPAQFVNLLLPGLQVDLPLGPTPPAPTIDAPRGELPMGPGGLKEWTQYGDAEYGLSGSGFLLRLADGSIIGLTTSHSMVTLGQPGHTLKRIAFTLPDGLRPFVAEFDTLYGPPGQPLWGGNLTRDYVLLKVNGAIDESLALTPDPRGGAQLGERVTIYGGVGDLNDGRRIYAGTVVKINDQGAWMLMDEMFEPGMMSGSPIFSQHTGLVVGMAMARGVRAGKLFIGFHPIGHLVELAEAAKEFPKIEGYRR
jgi:hypothetical protein